MFVQIAPMRKCLPTLCADVWFVIGVGAHVSVQIILARERPFAHIT